MLAQMGCDIFKTEGHPQVLAHFLGYNHCFIKLRLINCS